MTWFYHGVPITEPADYFGFVYIITNKQTGKQYIGRKLFTKAKIKQKSKTNKRKKKLRVESNWLSYFGSSAELLADVNALGKDQFLREILHLCKTRAECNYREAYEILMREALLRDNFYNRWVSLKLHKSTLTHLKIIE